MDKQDTPKLARGTFFHLIAKVINLAANFLINIILARYLGVDKYGMFGVIVSLISILQILVWEGMVNALSKYIIKNPENSKLVESLSLRVQVIESIIIITVITIFSPFIASVLGSSLFSSPIRIVSFVILLTAITAVYSGILGGRRLFGLQASIMAINGVVRCGLITLCIVLNGSLIAIFWAYTISFLPGALIGKKYIGSTNRMNDKAPKGILQSVFYLTLLSVLFNLFIHSGILFLQHILKTSTETGLYQASSVIARTLLLFFTTLGTTLLPSITASIHTKDTSLTRRYIKQGMRYLLLISIPITVIISIKSTAILKLVFSDAFSSGGNTLTLLVWAIEFFSIYYILNTIIIADSKYTFSIITGIFILALSIGLYYYMIPRWAGTGLAAATLVSGIGSVLITSCYILLKHHTLINPLTIIRLILISLVIIGIERVVTLPDLFVVGECIGLYSIFIIFLYLCREFVKEDWNVLANIIKLKVL